MDTITGFCNLCGKEGSLNVVYYNDDPIGYYCPKCEEWYYMANSAKAKQKKLEGDFKKVF